MNMNTSPPAAGNQGVQATNVHADVLAVGTGAKAIKNVGGLDADTLATLKDALSRLDQGIAQLNLNQQAADLLRQETRAMTEMAESGTAEPGGFQLALKGLKDKLAMIGVVIADVVALAGPVKSIAQALRLPLSSLGL